MGRAYQNRKESIAKTSDAKAKVYSRYGREVYVAAKGGTPEPETNAALASVIERARREQVPAHVIEKAIEKAKGGGGEDYAAARYEGYGPGGAMVIVECLTDNPTRTFNEVRNAFNKGKGKIGNTGSVAHLFDHCAIFSFAGDDEDTVLEALLGADVDVTEVEVEDGMVTVFTPNTEYGKAKQALKESFDGIEFEVDEIQFVPQATAKLEGDDAAQFQKMLDLIEYCDDVQQVYHSVEL